MSNGVDLSEFLHAYLGEADEHLANANAQLLTVEASLRRGEPVARPVRELFRALHTIKGLSAMVGVDAIVSIAHRMETVLRSADRGGGQLSSAAVDVLLEGTRAIEQRVQTLHAGGKPSAPPSSLLDALDALDITQEAKPVPARSAALGLDPSIAQKLAPFEHDALVLGVAAGRRAVSARFAPSSELAGAGVSINSVREKLGAIAEIVKVVPVAMARGPAAPAGLAFVLVALTTRSDEELAAATGLDAASITSIAEPTLLEVAPSVDAPEKALPDDPDYEAGARRSDVVRVDVVRLDDALERLSALIVSRSKLAREITRLGELGVDTRGLIAVLREQSRQLKDLRASILGLRMVPLTEVLERVPLIVRGLRRATGKSVALRIDVGRAELDKAVAERIFPAIIHLIRNAVDHGIEAPDVRARAGKPAEGSLRIECAAVGNAQLELRIGDDGCGIDRAELARRAAAPVPDDDAAVLQLLCRPGLSTRDQASDTSGRGMGMDIVRRIVVEQLGGQLSLRSEKGRGTTFFLRVPLTISIVDAFTFECGAHRFAVPLSTIEEIIELDLGAVTRGPVRNASSEGGVGVILRRGGAMSVVRLDRVLGLAAGAASNDRAMKALVLRGDGDAIAFAVDRMIGQQEIVVRALQDPLVQVVGIAGATDLGDGRPTLIVDLMALSIRHLEAQVTANGSLPRPATEHDA